ncbi:MAG TPA: hypothetical protein VE860_04590, partial [Chthoniobacterales bacterium]|nr:hypothetical protein [Chthoniobacterales bacterium]
LHAYDRRETALQAIAFLTSRPPDESTVEQIVEDSLRGAAPAKLAWPMSAAYENISGEVGKIDVPTLILAGDQDRQDPLEQQQREVSASYPQSTAAGSAPERAPIADRSTDTTRRRHRYLREGNPPVLPSIEISLPSSATLTLPELG